MIETKIYFSYENKEQLKEIIDNLLYSSGLEGFTVYKTKGYWNKIYEPSRIIEIISDNITLKNEIIVKQIANKIKQIANQKSVLITTKSINSEFV